MPGMHKQEGGKEKNVRRKKIGIQSKNHKRKKRRFEAIHHNRKNNCDKITEAEKNGEFGDPTNIHIFPPHLPSNLNTQTIKR